MNLGLVEGSSYRGRLLLSVHAIKNTARLKLRQQIYKRKHRPPPRLPDSRLYVMKAHLVMGSLLPFKHRTWMGTNCSVPAGAHDISHIEFGAAYMTPAIYRAECVHNPVNGRSWY